ncbi:MAG: hypothetical protein HZB85_00800 [Deltaproteobacteria bacterium]|nr:hypothetical protein [Deltaproteobacteria bacterium]
MPLSPVIRTLEEEEPTFFIRSKTSCIFGEMLNISPHPMRLFSSSLRNATSFLRRCLWI